MNQYNSCTNNFNSTPRFIIIIISLTHFIFAHSVMCDQTVSVCVIYRGFLRLRLYTGQYICMWVSVM